MTSEIRDYITNQVSATTPAAIIDIIETQINRANDANTRITEEGLVVRDMKGSVIPHPAIAIEIQAHKIITDLIKKNS